jgi:hypothetical protein
MIPKRGGGRMSAKEETITLDEATRQVLSIVRRMALLHHSYARTLLKELGEEKGRQVIRKAIDFYGVQVGKKVRENTLAKGLETVPANYQEDLPRLGWNIEMVTVDGEPRARIRDCHLAQAWKELGAPELGRLYCYMDQTKYEAYDPALECVHEKNILDGDAYCELAVRTRKGKAPGKSKK